MLIVIYSRVIDNKKKGLVIEGPFLGPECETMDGAHEECRKIVSPSKDTILIRVYDLEEHSYQSAVDHARGHFGLLFESMESAAKICDRPKKRTIKRTPKPKKIVQPVQVVVQPAPIKD
jgi:hypothetical protein